MGRATYGNRVPGLLATAFAAAVLVAPARAFAVGGVFVPSFASTPTVGHRVALAVQSGGTIEWDQITVTSTSLVPAAWVIPIRKGATVDLTGESFFTALESTTDVVVYSPPDFGPAAGCSMAAVAGCSRDPAFGQGPDRLGVRRVAVTEPAESAIVKGADPNALPTWLKDHGFSIPSDLAPQIAAYAREGWDFSVHRFAPACTFTSRPVRVTSPGAADAILPTRLLGAGARSGQMPLTLFTFADTRLVPTGIGTTMIEADRLLWNEDANKSNYDQLLLAAQQRAAFVTEVATVPSQRSSRARLPTFYDLYPGLCGTEAIPNNVDVSQPTATSCPAAPTVDAGKDASRSDASDASPDVADASDDADAEADTDASDDASTSFDASEDASNAELDASDDAAVAVDATTPLVTRDTCSSPDDLSVLLRGGLDPRTTVLTRMRGQVSIALLSAADLKLVPDKGLVSNQLQAVAYDDEHAHLGDNKTDHPDRSATCAAVQRTEASSSALIVALTLLGIGWSRRRFRR